MFCIQCYVIVLCVIYENCLEFEIILAREGMFSI